MNIVFPNQTVWWRTMVRILRAALCLAATTIASTARAENWLSEPIEIGTRSQLFVDDALIDNRYSMQRGSAAQSQVLRKFHAPQKFLGNPVLAEPDVLCIYHAVRCEPERKLFRMWYGCCYPHVLKERPETLPGHYHIRYAESKDGIHWTRPNLGLYPDPYYQRSDSNIVLASERFDKMEYREREAGKSALANNWIASPGPIFLDETEIPPGDRRGYKYVMTYSQSGRGEGEAGKNQVFVIGSHDGIHWDREHQVSLGMFGISDGWLSIVYDPLRKKYVSFTRPRDRYQGSGNSQAPSGFESAAHAYEGVVRRIGTMENDQLWTKWDFAPRTIFLPDEQDLAKGASELMSISMKYYDGVYFGYLKPFHHQVKLWSELVVSRDGRNFERLHEKVLDTGSEGTWDSGQAWASGGWIEVGDEWWIYYFASSRGPNLVLRPDEGMNIGLMKIRKEGFLSMHSPAIGGVVVTRLVRWPGGELLVNCDVPDGELRVRVSDLHRATIPGFDFTDSISQTGGSVQKRMQWKAHSLDELKGRDIRLEFYMSKESDLYGFRATGERR